MRVWTSTGLLLAEFECDSYPLPIKLSLWLLYLYFFCKHAFESVWLFLALYFICTRVESMCLIVLFRNFSVFLQKKKGGLKICHDESTTLMNLFWLSTEFFPKRNIIKCLCLAKKKKKKTSVFLCEPDV